MWKPTREARLPQRRRSTTMYLCSILTINWNTTSMARFPSRQCPACLISAVSLQKYQRFVRFIRTNKLFLYSPVAENSTKLAEQPTPYRVHPKISVSAIKTSNSFMSAGASMTIMDEPQMINLGVAGSLLCCCRVQAAEAHRRVNCAWGNAFSGDL